MLQVLNPTRSTRLQPRRRPRHERTLAVRRAAGALLVIVPLGFTVCFTLLQQLFEYPDILRQPTADVLTKFAAGGTPLIAVWYVLTLTAVAFIPLTVLVHRVLAEREAPVLLWVATAFGVDRRPRPDAGLPALAIPGAAPGAVVPGAPARARRSAPRRRWSSRPSTATPAWPSASTWAT